MISVLPGMIYTPMPESIRSTFEALSPVPIDEADFVSGAAVPVDNGLSAGLF